jgi:hypothetical protein
LRGPAIEQRKRFNDKGPKKTLIRLIAAGPFQRDIMHLIPQA